MAYASVIFVFTSLLLSAVTPAHAATYVCTFDDWDHDWTDEIGDDIWTMASTTSGTILVSIDKEDPDDYCYAAAGINSENIDCDDDYYDHVKFVVDIESGFSDWANGPKGWIFLTVKLYKDCSPVFEAAEQITVYLNFPGEIILYSSSQVSLADGDNLDIDVKLVAFSNSGNEWDHMAALTVNFVNMYME